MPSAIANINENTPNIKFSILGSAIPHIARPAFSPPKNSMFVTTVTPNKLNIDIIPSTATIKCTIPSMLFNKAMLLKIHLPTLFS